MEKLGVVLPVKVAKGEGAKKGITWVRHELVTARLPMVAAWSQIRRCCSSVPTGRGPTFGVDIRRWKRRAIFRRPCGARQKHLNLKKF